LKLAGYGFAACCSFMEGAFGQTFGAQGLSRLAPALFGGQDGKGRPQVMASVAGFDKEAFRDVASELSSVTDESELLGGLLATAIAVAELGADAKSPLEEFGRACDGMCVSNAMREAGAAVLQTAARLAAAPAQPGRLERGFAAACGVPEEALCLHLQVWEALQLCAPRAGPPGADAHRRRLAIALLRGSPRAADARHIAEALAFERPPIRGSALGIKGLLDVPPTVRRQVMILLEVGLRLLRSTEPFETEEHLRALFGSRPLLREALAATVWYEDDGKTLRQEFQPVKKAKK